MEDYLPAALIPKGIIQNIPDVLRLGMTKAQLVTDNNSGKWCIQIRKINTLYNGTLYKIQNIQLHSTEDMNWKTNIIESTEVCNFGLGRAPDRSTISSNVQVSKLWQGNTIEQPLELLDIGHSHYKSHGKQSFC